MSEWLQKYYGKEADFLNPEIILDGKKKAIIRLTRTGGKGFSGIGYVLVDKHGSHSTSSPMSLFEGVPSLADMNHMRETLQKEDQ